MVRRDRGHQGGVADAQLADAVAGRQRAHPGARSRHLGEHLEGVVSVDIVDGRIANFFVMRNPEKLAGVTVARRVRR